MTDREDLDCKFCSNSISNTETQTCDRCHNLVWRIAAAPAKVLSRIIKEEMIVRKKNAEEEALQNQ